MGGGKGMGMGGDSLEAEGTEHRVSAGARQGRDSGAAAQPMGVAGRYDMPGHWGDH